MRMQGTVARGFAAWALALSVAGCSGWSYEPPMRGNPSLAPHNLQALRSVAPSAPTTFNQALAADYAGFAGSLRDEHRDFADTDYFARKGLAAANGAVVPPEDNRNWLIPLEIPDQYRTEIARSRERLMAALDRGGRDQQPLVAARAQVSYDCWVERMEDTWWTAADGPCRKQFLDALALLEGQAQAPAQPVTGPGPAREFRVYFEFDRSELLPEAQQILQQVASLAKEQGNLKVVLVGKADRAGSDNYNLALSKRRAETVRGALMRDGVAGDRIDTRWVGESEPPVPTPDGVREPRNRVVEINLR